MTANISNTVRHTELDRTTWSKAPKDKVNLLRRNGEGNSLFPNGVLRIACVGKPQCTEQKAERVILYESGEKGAELRPLHSITSLKHATSTVADKYQLLPRFTRSCTGPRSVITVRERLQRVALTEFLLDRLVGAG